MARIPTADSLDDVPVRADRPMATFDRSAMAAVGAPGRALADAGKAVSGIGATFQEQEDKQEAFEVERRLIQFGEAEERRLAEDTHNMEPGGDGFATGWRGRYDEAAKAAKAQARTDGLSERALIALDRGLVSRAEQYQSTAFRSELTERDRFHVEQTTQTLGGLQNRAAENPSDLPRYLEDGERLINRARLTPRARAQALTQFRLDATKAAVEARADAGDVEGEIERLRQLPRGARAPAAAASPFDAEGEGYDDARASAAGMKPAGPEAGENAGHMGSVAETTPEERRRYGLPAESYVVLKGRKHESWDLAQQGEEQRGFRIVQRGDRYFSVPADAELKPHNPEVPGMRDLFPAGTKSVTPLEIARRYLGQGERTHTRTLSEFFRRSGGQSLNPAKTAWCMAFVNAVLGEAGIEGTGTLMARDALKIGTESKDPKPGDIVVLSRGAPGSGLGHVGFFVGRDRDGGVKILAGNQGDRVSVASYPESRVLGFRTPPKAGTDVPGVEVPVEVAQAPTGTVTDADNAAVGRSADRQSEPSTAEGLAPDRLPTAASGGWSFVDQPAYPHLKMSERQTMIRNLQIRMREVTASALREDIQNILDGREPQRDANGRTSLERAQRIMTPNQLERWRQRWDEAQQRRRAIVTLQHLPSDEALDQLEDVSPMVRGKVERVWGKVAELRESDPARAVSGSILQGADRSPRIHIGADGSPEVIGEQDTDVRLQPAPEVARAYQQNRRRRPEVSIGIAPDGAIVLQAEAGREASVAQSWRTIFEARLAAQARLGIPDYQRRIITKAEAARLLAMPSDAGMDDTQYDQRLRTAADRAQAWYGPAFARQAFEEAIAFRSTSAARRREATDMAANLLRGETITEEHLRRLQSLQRIDREAAMWRYGAPAGPYERAQQMADPRRNELIYDPLAGQSPDRPAISPGNAPDLARSSAATRPRQPSQEAIDLIMRNPKLQARFDAEYGPGAYARVMAGRAAGRFASPQARRDAR